MVLYKCECLLYRGVITACFVAAVRATCIRNYGIMECKLKPDYFGFNAKVKQNSKFYDIMSSCCLIRYDFDLIENIQ